MDGELFYDVVDCLMDFWGYRLIDFPNVYLTVPKLFGKKILRINLETFEIWRFANSRKLQLIQLDARKVLTELEILYKKEKIND